MKYNAKYDRYVTKGGLVYRYDKRQNKLVLCKPTHTKTGYLQLSVTKPGVTHIYVHRLVYETFVSEIPQGFHIDHINTVKTDNSLENLRCVTQKENNNNPLTRKHNSNSQKGNTNARNKTHSEFGDKFRVHFGLSKYENTKLYNKEYWYYYKHNNTCRWEKE